MLFCGMHPVLRITLSFLFLLTTIAFVVGGVAYAQPPTNTGPAQMVDFSAALYEHTVVNGEEVLKLTGNVKGTQGAVRVSSDKATFYPARNYADLIGNVRVEQPGIVMTGPRAIYNGATRTATAPDGVTLVDNGATLRAGAGDFDMSRKISYFRNGVTLNDGKSNLRAGSGEYWSNDRKAIFRDNVQVQNDSGTINARQITHWRDSQESFAVGSVVLVSRQNAVRLTGDTLIHRPSQGYSMATGGRPKLVKIDTTRSNDSSGSIRLDTTVISARTLESFRQGREEYVATDDVRFRRGKLEAVAGLARYLPNDNTIALGSGGHAVVDTLRRKPTDTSAVTGGNAGKQEKPILARGPSPVVWYNESQLTGDSIAVGLIDKKLRLIDVMGHAFALNEGKLPDIYDQMAGSRILIDVQQDTIRQVLSQEYASTIYFIYNEKEKDPPRMVRESGDTIAIDFDKGAVSTATVVGRRSRAEGEYFPDSLVKGREATFRLEGFRLYDRDGSLRGLNSSTPKPLLVPEVGNIN